MMMWRITLRTMTLIGLPCLLTVLSVGQSAATVIGTTVIGQSYPIAEPHFLKSIDAKLRAMEASGQLAHHQREIQQRIQNDVERPASVMESLGIQRASQLSVRYFDPSITTAKPIMDQQGRMVAPAGRVTNPLDTIRLTRQLIFIDGRDAQQVAWLKERLKEHSNGNVGQTTSQTISHTVSHIKPILLAGEPLKLMREWKTPIYFDQQGVLSKRFGLTHVPAVIRQDLQSPYPKALKIETVALSQKLSGASQ
jgi:conjugal transfer pilus assembly protein TraW